jgi:hypothetical protein
MTRKKHSERRRGFDHVSAVSGGPVMHRTRRKPCVSQSVTTRPVRGCCPDPPTPRRHAGVSVSVRDGRSVSISFLTASKMGAMTGPHPHGSQKCRAVRPAVSRPPRDCGAHFRRLISRNCLLPPSRKRQEPRDTRSPPAQAAPCRSRAAISEDFLKGLDCLDHATATVDATATGIEAKREGRRTDKHFAESKSQLASRLCLVDQLLSGNGLNPGGRPPKK